MSKKALMQDCIHFEACSRQAHFWVAIHGDIFAKTCHKGCPVYESKDCDTCYLSRAAIVEYKRTGYVELLEGAQLDEILRSVSPWRYEEYLDKLGSDSNGNTDHH